MRADRDRPRNVVVPWPRGRTSLRRLPVRVSLDGTDGYLHPDRQTARRAFATEGAVLCDFDEFARPARRPADTTLEPKVCL
jgi:hypothetical protein